MEIINLFPGSYASNCSLLLSDGHAAIVDPSPRLARMQSELESRGVTLDFILLTHGHFDHVLSLDELRDLTGVPAYIHEKDAEMLPDSDKNGFSYFFSREKCFREAEKTFADGDELVLGSETIRVVHTPGHTRGSSCFLIDESGALLTGDTLFDGNIGRYDLYGGDRETIFASLNAMRSLPQDLTIYPGHGGTVRLGDALDAVLPTLNDW